MMHQNIHLYKVAWHFTPVLGDYLSQTSTKELTQVATSKQETSGCPSIKLFNKPVPLLPK